MRKACLVWRIHGFKGRCAAGLLSKVPSMKQAQLQLAAAATMNSDAPVEELSQQLTQLKQKDHCPKILKCTWPYFAGFFDAEGSVTISPMVAGIQLHISQINPFVLRDLCIFLHQNGLEGWRLHEGKHCSRLYCLRRATARQTLSCLLNHGLLVKRKQAELALSVSSENYRQVREAVFSLNGWQNRYHRLDEEGIKRAKQILALQYKSRRESCAKEWKLLQGDLRELQTEHKLQNLVSKCSALRKDIRKSLSEGAVWPRICHKDRRKSWSLFRSGVMEPIKEPGQIRSIILVRVGFLQFQGPMCHICGDKVSIDHISWGVIP
eukprot:Skav205423  [mRNA]  locus=scaffold582:302356:303321:- [translate_table: standard]